MIFSRNNAIVKRTKDEPKGDKSRETAGLRVGCETAGGGAANEAAACARTLSGLFAEIKSIYDGRVDFKP